MYVNFDFDSVPMRRHVILYRHDTCDEAGPVG